LSLNFREIPGVFDAIADWHKYTHGSFANRDCALSTMRYEEAAARAVIFHGADTSSSFCSFPFGRMDAAGCQNLTTLPADSFSQTNQLRLLTKRQQQKQQKQDRRLFIFICVSRRARALILSRARHIMCVCTF
jgi:hypothetical protein